VTVSEGEGNWPSTPEIVEISGDNIAVTADRKLNVKKKSRHG
jgi:hypothetical protein